MRRIWEFYIVIIFFVLLQQAESLTTFGRKKIEGNTSDTQSVDSSSQLQNCDEKIQENIKDISDALANLKDRVRKLELLNQNDGEVLYDEHFNCIKDCNPMKRLPQSCSEATASNGFRDGVYLLDIVRNDLKPFYVYCHHENGTGKAWTVIQRRENGSISFNRNWLENKQSFGDLNSEYWIGLDRLHAMTTSIPHRVWVLVIEENGNRLEGNYWKLEIASENENYKITVDGGGDGKGNENGNYNLGHFNNAMYSTYDKDNDLVVDNCAQACEVGWWYKSCFGCTANKRFFI